MSTYIISRHFILICINLKVLYFGRLATLRLTLIMFCHFYKCVLVPSSALIDDPFEVLMRQARS